MNHLFKLSSGEQAYYSGKESEIEVYLANRDVLVIDATEFESTAFHDCITDDLEEEGYEISGVKDYIEKHIAFWTEGKIEKREYTLIPN